MGESMNPAMVEECFRKATILQYGLQGLHQTAKDSGFKEEQLAESIFAFFEVADDLAEMLGKVHCPPGEAEAST